MAGGGYVGYQGGGYSGGGANQTSAGRQRSTVPTQSTNQNIDYLVNQYQANLPGQLPGYISAQNQYNQLSGSLPGVMANYQQQEQYTQQEAGLEQQQLGLQGQQLGIQQGALNRQEVLDPKLQALTVQGFRQQMKDLQANYAYQKAGTESAGVAGGSVFTAGQRSTVGLQAEQFQSAKGGLQRSQQSEALNYREQLSQLQDQQKNLGVLSQQLGLSGQEITSRTQNALQQLGLSQMVSVQQINQAMVDAEQGTMNPLASILGQVYQLSGIRPVSAGG